MLKLNDERNILEGGLKLSDCEREFVVKWLSGSSQASFFIGDTQELHDEVKNFIHGKHKCYLDLPSYVGYLKIVKQISTKYKSMYHGPIDKIDDYISKYSHINQEDAVVILSYDENDRYIRILNDKSGYNNNRVIFGDNALKNGDDFRHSFMGGITNIKIKKENDKYLMSIRLIDNWRDVIMQEKGKKVNLEALVNIYNDEMNQNINDGKTKEEAAQIFGVKYAPLLENNKDKFTYKDIIDNSSFKGDELKDAVAIGIKMSSAIIWSSDFAEENDLMDDNNDENYIKFKSLLGWFIKQLNINNGLESGTKTSGQGYKEGSAIREQYKEWRDYGDFTLDCNIIAGYQSAFSKVNYINKTETGINVRPRFDKATKEIVSVYIDVYDPDNVFTNDISNIVENEYKTRDLELFDGKEPNDLLKELFDNFKKVIETLTLPNNKIKELPTRSPRTTKIHPLNAILYGAPGTGKTYATAEYAVAIIENRDIKDEDREELMKRYRELQKEGKITFTTFHQSYGYEDFIQGLRPETKDGVMEFKPVDGVFKRIADKALNDNNSNYVIIIDEINRANMSKVLGELITLIEEDKRWGEINELSVTLPSGEVFVVPNNLYIIGTMNTADKSISIIDVALRRRFEFIEQQVEPSKVANTKLREVLNKINSKLKDETDSIDLLVGHAYFMNKTIEDLDKLLNRAIIPLLYEYFFDNGKKVKSVVEEAISGTGYKVDSSTLGRIKVVKE